MSFFSFIKDVGEKILGLATAAEINAADLKKDLDALGLDTKDLTVELDGDNVVLKGTAKETSIGHISTILKWETKWVLPV